MKTDRFFFFLLLLLLIIFSGMVLVRGPTPFSEVSKHAISRLTQTSNLWNPLLDERLPRLLILFMTGASLTLSGALLQSLFQTPLASQDVLGLTSGGSLAVSIAFLCLPESSFTFSLPMAGAFGTFLSLLLIFTLSKMDKEPSLAGLLMIGIALSSLLSATNSAISYWYRHEWEWTTFLTEWKAGSSLDRSWDHVGLQFPLFASGIISAFLLKREVDLLSFGEKEAYFLGICLKKTRFKLFFSIALLNGGAIAGLGNLPFFGFLLPLMVRLLSGPESWRLFPLSIMIGGVFLIAMDVFLREMGILAFSLGHLSALIGSLVFLLLILLKPRFAC